MLAFLHTALAHVESFGRLAREVDDAITVRHEVREELLAEARRAGAITAPVRAATTEAVRMLADEGARVIVCTCSTIGAVAEAVPVADHVRVVRIDRPMAEQAVASDRRIVVFATVRSTFAPTAELLRAVASDATRSVEVVEVFCERAWPYFELGDHAGYLREIARTIEANVRSSDQIVLAQASMAPASDLVRHLGIPVLSSPRLGVEAALSMYRACGEPTQPSPTKAP